MNHEETVQQIRLRLTEAFSPIYLDINDDSHKHRHHTEAKAHPKAGHFDVTIVAPAFTGKSAIERHRMVYAALNELMPAIHALSIDAKAP